MRRTVARFQFRGYRLRVAAARRGSPEAAVTADRNFVILVVALR
jgi:hypothetical protein